MRMLSRLIAAAFFVMALSFAASAQKATRVTFAKGATSATVSGQMSGFRTERVYVIRVLPGQTLSVEQADRSKPVTIYIQDPTGEDATDMDLSCHSKHTISNTLRGDYRITVTECKKADPWRGTYRIRFSVR
jgi:hypothetical protein